MKINQLIANNIVRLDADLPEDQSLGIAGLSGSGKTTFSQTIGEESKKRLVSLLPKAEYQYLFPNIMETNFSAIKMETTNDNSGKDDKGYQSAGKRPAKWPTGHGGSRAPVG